MRGKIRINDFLNLFFIRIFILSKKTNYSKCINQKPQKLQNAKSEMNICAVSYSMPGYTIKLKIVALQIASKLLGSG
jgi:hypothetical protein